MDNISSPHKAVILKVGKRCMHVAHQIHIGKLLQSVETNRDVIVSMLAKWEVDRVVNPESAQTNDICCFSARYAPVRRKKKGSLSQN